MTFIIRNILFSILIFYLFLYNLDTVSDWLNGLRMIGLDPLKMDNLFEKLFENNLFNSSLLESSEEMAQDWNTTDISFRWVASHKHDQIWGIMTICTTFIPGFVYGLGNILCYFTKRDTYLYGDLSETSVMNVGLKSLFLMLFFPVYVTWLMIRTCFRQDESNFQRLLAVVLLEGFLESAPQVT